VSGIMWGECVHVGRVGACGVSGCMWGEWEHVG